MKSEKEIRSFLKDLKRSVNQKCGCANTSHALDCLIGGEQVKAEIQLLSWVLDEHPEFDRLVELFAR